MTEPLTVWELCDHQQTRPHDYPIYTSTAISIGRCEGGREIVLLAPIVTWTNCDDVLEALGVPGTDRKFRLVEVTDAE